MIFIIAAFYWLGVARLVRGETLTLRTREYVQAVKVIGGARRRSIVRHIVPNAIGTIIVQATFAVADSILILAGLGFLGLGVQPPGDRLGRHAVRRPDLHAVRHELLVADLPAGHRDHPDLHRVQLHRRRAPRRVRDPAAAPVGWQGRKRRDLVAPLLEINDLRTEIRLKQAVVHAVDGVSLPRGARGDARHRGRVGLRQDHDRAVDHEPAADRRVHRRRQHQA